MPPSALVGVEALVDGLRMSLCLPGSSLEVDDALGRAGHDQGHLAADLLGGPGGELGDRAADDLQAAVGEVVSGLPPLRAPVPPDRTDVVRA